MIIRLSQKLAKKLKVSNLASCPLDSNLYADWSAHLFTADRTQYIILTNTQSLYSVVMYGRGITDDTHFVRSALDTIGEFMEKDGQAFVYQRFIAPASTSVTFAKALNRSVTGSMNEMIAAAIYGLVEHDSSPDDVSFRLNEILLSALGYRRPREALKQLADRDPSSAETAEPVAPAEPDPEAEDARSSSAASALGVLLTYAQRREVAEIFPESTGRLKLDEPKTRSIPFTTDEMETIRTRAKAAIPHVENGMKRNSLRHVVRTVTKILEKSKGIRAIPAHERVYQFKITLLEFEPLIWRRIQVKDCTLDKLHAHIQTAMGWTNSHLHQFVIDGKVHGDPELICDGWQGENTPVDSLHTRIGTIVPEDGKRYRFLYEYDFGDGWQHEVLFEGCLRASKQERYPLCVEGERACPPEDVGGVRGYAEFLEALADPDHEQHDEYGEWVGPCQPERFDAEKTTKAMRRGLRNWRLYR